MGGLSVSGGADSFDAKLDDLDVLAGLSLEVAGDLGALSARLHGILIDPEVLASGILDPTGLAAFEGALLLALDGPGGITARAAGYGLLGAAIKASATAYRAADAAGKVTLDALAWAEGHTLGPLGSILNAVSDPAILLGLAKEGIWDQLPWGDHSFDWQRVLTDHPGVIDHLIGNAPGFLTGLGLPSLTSGHGAAWLGLLYGDTGGVLSDRGSVPVDGESPSRDLFYQHGDADPRGPLERLMASLDQRNLASAGADQGQIDVKAIPQPDGTTKYVVTMPGTKDWQFNPLGDNPYANDLATNLHAMAGHNTVYEQMVAKALHDAGAPPGADVMLIGHSQGGIVAANAAADSATGEFPYHVTHVVTAGSPIANIPIPKGTQVLSFENSHDIVPHLDGHSNPAASNVTTVTFDNQHGTMGENHSTASNNYGGAAQQADTAKDPSIDQFVSSASSYFDPAGTPSTHVYQITRH